MKYLQTFSLFESRTPGTLTKRQEAFLNRYTEGTWSVNPATGLVDVQGSFICHYRDLKTLCGIRFGTVTGDFWCSNNKLTSLVGAPQAVEGEFYCYHNQLTTLEGAPQTVGREFSCYDNPLTSLVGAPQTVGAFSCNEFQLGPGKWNSTGWLEVLRTGSPEARKLMSTLPYLNADWWNSELSKDTARTIQLLAPLWSGISDDLKRGIRIPPGYEDRFGMRSEFSDLGLF